MSSELAPAVATLQFNNYQSLAITTAITYDYIITFSQEIHYIWNRPWTFVSAMYFVVRYLGLAVCLIEGLYGSTFIPGPTLVSTVLLLASDYTFIVFLAAADFMMILRMYAMYQRSKIVLGLLLGLYVAMIVLYSISAAYYDKLGTNLMVTNPQILGVSFCYPAYDTSTRLGRYKLAPRLILAGLMFILAVTRLCADSYQVYKETRQWKTNQYVSLLVREGVLYFLAHVFNNINFGESTAGMVMSTITFAVVFILSPRFVMSVRALHERRISGRYTGIDTGFGIAGVRTPQSSDTSSLEFVHSSMASEGDVEMQPVGNDSDAGTALY